MQVRKVQKLLEASAVDKFYQKGSVWFVHVVGRLCPTVLRELKLCKGFLRVSYNRANEIVLEYLN